MRGKTEDGGCVRSRHSSIQILNLAGISCAVLVKMRERQDEAEY